jgi:hypothetical protein
MPRIIREKYENGVLVERHIEGSALKLRKWVQLAIHSVIAISLVVLAAMAVHDSLALHGAMVDEEARPAGCEQPRFRS